MAVKHRIRTNGNGKTKIKVLNARKAIIEHCKECMGFNAWEVRRCTSVLCALFPFRTRDTPKDTAEIVAYENLSDENRRSKVEE